MMQAWLYPSPLLLASASRTRRAILHAAGLPVEVQPAEIDERAVEDLSDLTEAEDVADLLATAKARSVSMRHPGRLVAGADQTLALGTERFGKPRERAQAREQLRALRGRTHRLCSAVSVVCDGILRYAHVETAHLTMRDFSDEFLERYLDAAEAALTSSVGGYQLEGVGVQLFERVQGDHFTVLGLPLLPLLLYLRRDGFLLT